MSKETVKDLVFIWCGCLIWLFGQLYWMPTDFGSYDSINFALSLHFYHIPSLSPHFPGYPGYIFLAKCFSFFGCSPNVALILPGLLTSFATTWLLLFFAKYYHFSREQTFFVVFFYLCNPVLSINSLQAFSDCASLYFWIWALKQTLLKKTKSSAFCCALGIAIRPSYVCLSFLFFLLHYKQHQFFRFSLFFCLFAVLPLAFFYGLVLPKEFAIAFLEGHFSSWGGTVWGTSPSFSTPFFLFWTHVMGGFWSGREFYRIFFILFLLFPFIARKKNFYPKELLGWSGIYLGWIFLAQNINNPRHFLPLLFPFWFLWVGSVQRYFLAVFFLLFCSVGATWQTLSFFQEPSLYAKWENYLDTQYSYLDVKIYGGRLLRILDWSPQKKQKKWLRKTVITFQEIQADVITLEYPPAKILITSEVHHFPDFLRKKIVCSFSVSPYLYPLENTVALFECTPEDILTIRQK